MADQWQMPRRSDACAACGRSFEPGELIQAFLYEVPEGYQRLDLCENCAPPPAPTAIGSWKTRRPEPTAPPAPSFDRAAIYRLFEQLADAETPEKRQLRFLLALLLWRKKVLRLERSERTGDGELWHFTAPRAGQTHVVARPELNAERLDDLEKQLEQLLAGQIATPDVLAAEAPGEGDA